MKRIRHFLRFIQIRLNWAKYAFKSVMLLKLFSLRRLISHFNPVNRLCKASRTLGEPGSLPLKECRTLILKCALILSKKRNNIRDTIDQEFAKLNTLSPDVLAPTSSNDEQQNGVLHSEPTVVRESSPHPGGDLGQKAKRLWDELNIGEVIGEELTNHISALLDQGATLKTQLSGSLPNQLAEYLQEELRLIPTRAELNNFFNDIDELSLTVERLQAQVNQLMSVHEIN